MHGMLLQVMAASGSTAAAQNHGRQRRSQAEDVDWRHLQVHQCPAAHMISLVLDCVAPCKVAHLCVMIEGVGCLMHGRGGGGVGSVASMDNSDAVEIFSMECAMHIMHSVLHCH